MRKVEEEQGSKDQEGKGWEVDDKEGWTEKQASENWTKNRLDRRMETEVS